MKDGTLQRAGALLLIFTILCGLAYMLAMTGIAQLLFPYQANGSLITVKGHTYSTLLGQSYSDDGHLWGRIVNVDTKTFTDSQGHEVMTAGPSNLSPASSRYKELVAQRVARIVKADPKADTASIPEDLVTCSGSGLDPDISPAAADYQVPRIAAATGRSPGQVRAIIQKYTTGRFLGLFGEPRVNVLEVNLALDGIL